MGKETRHKALWTSLDRFQFVDVESHLFLDTATQELDGDVDGELGDPFLQTHPGQTPNE